MDHPDFITENPDGTATIALTRPHQLGGATTDKVTMREPTVGDQLAASKGTPAQNEVALFANLCEVAPDEIKALPLRDYRRLQDAYMLFTI